VNIFLRSEVENPFTKAPLGLTDLKKICTEAALSVIERTCFVIAEESWIIERRALLTNVIGIIAELGCANDSNGRALLGATVHLIDTPLGLCAQRMARMLSRDPDQWLFLRPELVANAPFGVVLPETFRVLAWTLAINYVPAVSTPEVNK
jgi:hypothetical protein